MIYIVNADGKTNTCLKNSFDLLIV